MLRTLVVATVVLLGLGVAPPTSRPAAAALIERQDIPGLFRVYDELHFSGGSTTGETGFYNFDFRVGGFDGRDLSIATLFESHPLVVSPGISAKFTVFSQGGGPRRVRFPFEYKYFDEGLNLI